MEEKSIGGDGCFLKVSLPSGIGRRASWYAAMHVLNSNQLCQLYEWTPASSPRHPVVVWGDNCCSVLRSWFALMSKIITYACSSHDCVPQKAIHYAGTLGGSKKTIYIYVCPLSRKLQEFLIYLTRQKSNPWMGSMDITQVAYLAFSISIFFMAIICLACVLFPYQSQYAGQTNNPEPAF